MDYIVDNTITYESLADAYENNVSKYLYSTKKAINFFTPNITTGKEILDIGCGVGLATELLSQQGFKLTSIDISPKMVKYTKNRNPNSNVITGDFLKYKFKHKFDAIFAMAFIHLFPKEAAELVLRKMNALLNNDGALFIGTTLSNISTEGLEVKKDSFFPNGKWKRYRKHWTEEELLSSLQKERFKFKQKYYINDPRKKVWIGLLVLK